ncbi:hypothetical protein MAR_021847 [Mya arenaria]|uniref:Uncharacterized protein n=1 Tax=Mya arenaria TaxID=6604 RepID=A0ABY7E921_MYAAR|nr:hypothetical protein MAR_021847 [Mya arenaria]
MKFSNLNSVMCGIGFIYVVLMLSITGTRASKVLDVDPRGMVFHEISAEELQKRQIEEFADALGYGYIGEEDIKEAQVCIEHDQEIGSISRDNPAEVCRDCFIGSMGSDRCLRTTNTDDKDTRKCFCSQMD